MKRKNPMTEARSSAGYSRLALAAAIGVSAQTVSNWEDGKVTEPTTATIGSFTKMCKLFGWEVPQGLDTIKMINSLARQGVTFEKGPRIRIRPENIPTPEPTLETEINKTNCLKEWRASDPFFTTENVSYMVGIPEEEWIKMENGIIPFPKEKLPDISEMTKLSEFKLNRIYDEAHDRRNRLVNEVIADCPACVCADECEDAVEYGHECCTEYKTTLEDPEPIEEPVKEAIPMEELDELDQKNQDGGVLIDKATAWSIIDKVHKNISDEDFEYITRILGLR